MSMHEWLITRGNVMGAPFEWKMQIYVPWNCVLVHEGTCHLDAHHGDNKMQLVLLNHVLMYYKQSVIEDWLRNIMLVLTIAEEKLRWVQEHSIRID